MNQKAILRFIKSYNRNVEHFWKRITGYDLLPNGEIVFVNCKNKEILRLESLAEAHYGVHLSR